MSVCRLQLLSFILSSISLYQLVLVRVSATEAAPSDQISGEPLKPNSETLNDQLRSELDHILDITTVSTDLYFSLQKFLDHNNEEIVVLLESLTDAQLIDLLDRLQFQWSDVQPQVLRQRLFYAIRDESKKLLIQGWEGSFHGLFRNAIGRLKMEYKAGRLPQCLHGIIAKFAPESNRELKKWVLNDAELSPPKSRDDFEKWVVDNIDLDELFTKMFASPTNSMEDLEDWILDNVDKDELLTSETLAALIRCGIRFACMDIPLSPDNFAELLPFLRTGSPTPARSKESRFRYLYWTLTSDAIPKFAGQIQLKHWLELPQMERYFRKNWNEFFRLVVGRRVFSVLVSQRISWLPDVIHEPVESLCHCDCKTLPEYVEHHAIKGVKAAFESFLQGKAPVSSGSVVKAISTNPVLKLIWLAVFEYF